MAYLSFSYHFHAGIDFNNGNTNWHRGCYIPMDGLMERQTLGVWTFKVVGSDIGGFDVGGSTPNVYYWTFSFFGRWGFGFCSFQMMVVFERWWLSPQLPKITTQSTNPQRPKRSPPVQTSDVQKRTEHYPKLSLHCVDCNCIKFIPFCFFWQFYIISPLCRLIQLEFY